MKNHKKTLPNYHFVTINIIPIIKIAPTNKNINIHTFHYLRLIEHY
jgi:hypothetical protein